MLHWGLLLILLLLLGYPLKIQRHLAEARSTTTWTAFGLKGVAGFVQVEANRKDAAMLSGISVNPFPKVRRGLSLLAPLRK
jgi:hypothetical protein